MNAPRMADWRRLEWHELDLGGRPAPGAAFPQLRAGWRKNLADFVDTAAAMWLGVKEKKEV